LLKQLPVRIKSSPATFDAVYPNLRKTRMNKHSRFTLRGFKLAVMTLAICGAGSAMAATATATSTTTVVTPIAISNTANLSFGNIATGGSAGTVTVSPDGSRSVTGGTVTAGGTTTAAQFNVTGQSGLTYAIDFTGTSTTLTSGANTMTFTAISDTSASAITTGTAATGTLTGGAQTIFVGGTLAVGASQVAGTYNGTINVAVNYN
jgi:spore coat protein U-like protein